MTNEEWIDSNPLLQEILSEAKFQRDLSYSGAGGNMMAALMAWDNWREMSDRARDLRIYLERALEEATELYSKQKAYFLGKYIEPELSGISEFGIGPDYGIGDFYLEKEDVRRACWERWEKEHADMLSKETHD